ncbi:MAG: diacylglycerol kinase family protein [Bacteriovoracaceae bacterium]
MSKVSIYLNPKASDVNYDWASRIKSQLFRHDFELKMPKTKEELYSELDNDLANNVEYLFCIGGDGTVNTILQKIAGKDIKLLIIPGGTANDLAREVGMGRSLKNIIKAFQHKTHTKVDLIKVNDHYMCTNGGIGCAADVAAKINSYRESVLGFLNIMKGVGSNIYPLIFTKEMVFGKMKFYNLHLECQDLPLLNPLVKTPLVLVNNQSTLGGRFHVAPQTKNTDGKFNVTIFTHENKKDLLQCSYNLLTGNYPFHDKNLISFETDRLTINNLDKEPLTFFGDGEILNRDQILEIEACPQALEVCSYMDDLVYANSYDLQQISLL